MQLSPGDRTPDVGAQTDVAPLGRSGPKPAHERTAEEEAGNVDWSAIANSSEFHELLRRKAAMIIPATIFFIIYYFALPVLVGYFPEMMKQKVFGPVNWAYLFALSQFFMAWTLAAIYLNFAGRFDAMAAQILDRLFSRNK